MTVQVDAIPSDAFLKVETHGIEAIPDAERHGRPSELGFLWAGAFVNYASLLTASLLTTYYGLGVWDGLLAVLIGTLAGAVILGLLSNTGPKSGQPQIVFTRRIFGKRGRAAVAEAEVERGAEHQHDVGLAQRQAARLGERQRVIGR